METGHFSRGKATLGFDDILLMYLAGVNFLFFPHGTSFQLNTVSVMDQPVHERISDSWIADVIMPVLDGKLAGDEGGATAVAVLGHFKKISPFGIVQSRQCQIVKNKEMDFGESLHESSVTAIGTSESYLIEELRGLEIEGSGI